HRGQEAPKPKVEEESPHPLMPYPANPIGRGYVVGPLKEAVDGVELPNIEYPDRPLTPETLIVDLAEFDLKALEAAPGFAPYPPGWFPRAGLAGAMPWDLDAAE